VEVAVGVVAGDDTAVVSHAVDAIVTARPMKRRQTEYIAEMGVKGNGEQDHVFLRRGMCVCVCVCVCRRYTRCVYERAEHNPRRASLCLT
jgi:hypothetical protein